MKRLLAIFLTVIFLFGFSATAADAPSSWAQSEVNTAIELGLVPDSQTSLGSKPITRAQFVDLIVNLWRVWDSIGISTVSYKDRANIDLSHVSFSDCGSDSVKICANLGIIDGVGDGKFMPDAHLTRAQAAKILYNACRVFAGHITDEDSMITTSRRGISSHQLPHIFSDGGKIRNWAREHINWCYRHNVMSGVSKSEFNPDGEYTCEQAILTILRLYYLNGRVSENTIQNPKDFYPIYNGLLVEKWLSSTLDYHTTEEIGHVADKDAEVSFIVENTGVGSTYGHLIDKAGNVLLTDLWGSNGKFVRADIDYPFVYVIAKGYASRGVVNLETGETWRDKELSEITGKDYTAVAYPNGAEIRAKSGWYTIMSKDGEALSETYENAIRYVGDNLYIGWVSDYPRTSDILYCDGVNPARIVRTEVFRYNATVHSIGGGLYAVVNSDYDISVFDAFGDDIGKISSDKIGASGIITLEGFSNGLLRIRDEITQRTIYCTPEGIPVETK